MTRLHIIGNVILNQPSGPGTPPGRRQGFFSLDQIVRETGYRRDDSRQALAAFVKEGLIKEIRRQKKSQYKGGAAPLIILYAIKNRKALQTKIAGRVRQETNIITNQMWVVIRYKRIFTLRELIALSGAKRETARWFLKMLRRGGIIAPGRPTGPAGFWRLIKDPGPRRPYVGDQTKKD